MANIKSMIPLRSTIINGTFAYLSSILDAFTKQILAYVVSDSLEVDFVLETVNLLIENHGVSLHAEMITEYHVLFEQCPIVRVRKICLVYE
ncbi:MAG: hypothetical protein ACFN2Z_01980 [Oribacterium sp.]